MTVSQTFLVFDDLDCFECGSGSLWNVSHFGFVWLLSFDYIVVTGFWEEETRGKAPFSLYQGYSLPTAFITDDVKLDRQAEVVFVRFLHSKVIHFSHFSITFTLWKEVTVHSHTYGGVSYSRPPWRCSICLNYLGFFCMRKIFIHLFISMWTLGYLLHAFVYNPMLCCLFSCSNCYMAKSFSWFCVPLTTPIIV